MSAERRAAAHHAVQQLVVRDDCLVFAGTPLPQLAAEVGRTPFYAYDRAAMAARVAELRESLPRGIDLHYALKANPMPELVRHMVPLVDGIDVASAREMEIALAAGADAETVSFAGPGKTQHELARAADAGIIVNLESFNEMRALAALAADTRRRPRVAIRVNPDFELKTSGMKMGGGPQQFGVDAEQVPQMLQELRGLPLEFHGFHIFSGSQNLRADAIIETQSRTLELAVRLAEHAPGPVQLLNMGGGLGIPYFPGETPLDLAAVGRHLAQLLEEGRRLLPEARFALELGRFLVGEAGIYVCRIVDRKISRGRVFLVTDGGLHHHLAASGNFGQVLRKNYPVVIGNKIRGHEREIATIVGPLCTPLDLLADRMELAKADIGDLVVVMQSGAYGLTASPLGFLSHPSPVEVLL